jgi:paraquat-inducible protein B
MELRLGPQARRAQIAVTIEVSPNNVAKLNGAPVSSSLTTAQLVKRGLRAQLVTWSYVTSELAVNLTFKPGTRPHYTVNPKKLEFPEIPAIPSEIQQLKKTISKVPWQQTVQDLNQTLKSMVSLSQDMDRTISTLAPHLKKTNNSAQETLNTIRQAVASNNKQLQATIRSMHRLASNADTALTARNKQIAALLASAQKTGKNMQKLSQNLEGLTRPGSATHENLKSALRDLAASAANLRQFSETIARDPHALLFGD